MNINDLPKLKDKQQAFVMRYWINGNIPNDAYRYAYDCENMSDSAISVEASRLLKHPKVSLWIKYIEDNTKEVFVDELNYSRKDCFDELNDMKEIALNSFDKYGNCNIAIALRASELKGKLAGYFKEKHEIASVGLAEILDRLK